MSCACAYACVAGMLYMHIEINVSSGCGFGMAGFGKRECEDERRCEDDTGLTLRMRMNGGLTEGGLTEGGLRESEMEGGGVTRMTVRVRTLICMCVSDLRRRQVYEDEENHVASDARNSNSEFETR